jgi:hypothetical protein
MRRLGRRRPEGPLSKQVSKAKTANTQRTDPKEFAA